MKILYYLIDTSENPASKKCNKSRTLQYHTPPCTIAPLRIAPFSQMKPGKKQPTGKQMRQNTPQKTKSVTVSLSP